MALTRVKLEELIAAGEIEVGGGLSNPMPNTDLIVNLNADLLNGRHATWAHQNLLHNWDFRNPVNQRGVSGAISTGTYFYDRWLRNNGTVTTNAAYLTIGAAAEIEQRIEGNLLAGETVTVAVMVGGTVFSGTGIMPTSEGTASITLTGWGTATLGYATGYMYVRLWPTAASNVARVKLEMGTVSTLTYDPPIDYGAELAKCQRYFVMFGVYPIVYGYSGSATAGRVFISTPVKMRIAPSYSHTNLAAFTVTGLKSGSLWQSSLLGNGVWFEWNLGTGYTVSAPFIGYLGSGTDFSLSADL